MRLDHLTIAAPSLIEGVSYVEAAFGITVPFGTKHPEMGTHNHRLRIGPDVYLEIIATDPCGAPTHRRWFDLDDAVALRNRWGIGSHLRHWTVTHEGGNGSSREQSSRFGPTIPIGSATFSLQPSSDARFAWPCLIDRREAPSPVERMPDLGVRLLDFVIEHPHADRIEQLYSSLSIRGAPAVRLGDVPRYVATFSSPRGRQVLQ